MFQHPCLSSPKSQNTKHKALSLTWNLVRYFGDRVNKVI